MQKIEGNLLLMTNVKCSGWYSLDKYENNKSISDKAKTHHREINDR